MGWWTMWPWFGGLFEYVIFYNVAGPNTVRYWKVNLQEGTYEELENIAQPAAGSQTVVTDGTFVFLPTNTGLNLGQYKWDGSNFSQVLDAAHDGPNDVKGGTRLVNHDDWVLLAGVMASSHGVRIMEYKTSTPFSYPTKTSKTPASDFWTICMDFRYGNGGDSAYGDALVMAGQNGQIARSYENVGGTLTERGSVGTTSLGNTHAWGWDRVSGVFGSIQSISTSVTLYQCSLSDLSLSSIGTGTTTQIAQAIGFAPNGIVVTVEDTGGATDKIRTYTRSGSTLTEQDSYTLQNDTTSNAYIVTSPYTGHVWVMTANQSAGILALAIASDGTITVKFEETGHATSTPFGQGMAFTNGLLPTT